MSRLKKFTGQTVAGCMAISILLLWAPMAAAAQGDLPDEEITDAVEDQLRHDPAVSPATLDLSTTDGIVTLGGSTDNLLAKERAGKVAETVRGVRSVINLIEVRPPLARTDGEIRRDVEDALRADPAAEPHGISVTVENGVVTLTGQVDSWTEKNLSGTVAKGVRGVLDLENQIEVDLSVIRDDQEVEREVERVLYWDALVDAGLIEVGADDGRVILRGVVGSAAEKRRAVTDAHVAGVATVDASDLTVARWARDEDLNPYMPATSQEIEEAVKLALLYDPRVLGADVIVIAHEGILTLRGEVENLRAWRAVESVARNTVGVELVENRLRVRPEEPLSDPRIQEMVKNALTRNPNVDAEKILVTVANGIVKLSGSVESSYQRATADIVASGVSGVVDVENLLQVLTLERPLLYDPYLDQADPRELTWYRFQPFTTASTDTNIERAIEREFLWSPFVDGSIIDVEVENGVATLTGTVRSVRERQDATKNAYEGGALRVDNELTVVR